MGQAIWRFLSWRIKLVQDENLRTIRDDVRALRAKLAKGPASSAVLTGEAERQWVMGVDDSLRSIESHIGTAIGGRHAPKN